MVTFNGVFDKTVTDENGTVIISFAVSGDDKYNAKQCAKYAKKWHSEGRERLQINIDFQKKKRSLSANAYFHVLVNKIAAKMNLGNEEVKVKMVLEYGAVMIDDDGCKVGIKLPKSTDIGMLYPYAKLFDERLENGKMFNCYIIYKQTHTLDTSEMSRLIEGVVLEAEQLGIQTETPDNIAKMINLWGERKD